MRLLISSSPSLRAKRGNLWDCFELNALAMTNEYGKFSIDNYS